MSGVFGVVDRQERSLSASLYRMAHCLRLHDWTQIQLWSDGEAGVGLGQVNIGLFSTDAQPVSNEDDWLHVVFFGELYRTEPLLQRLSRQGRPLRDNTEAELVLRLYEVMGERFIEELEGVFVLALWDRRRGALLVANDRFGLIPTYYAHCSGRLLFAPMIGAVLSDVASGKRLDLTALAQFMRFQRLLGERTFFEGIHLLPYASLLRFHQATGRLEVSHYWDFDRVPEWPASATFEDAVAETGRLLREAVKGCLQGKSRIGVYLSGGLDSRTALALASQIRPPIVSLTYGVPGCRDAVYAQRIARRVKSPHTFLPLNDGHWVPEYADLHLEITGGMVTWTHSHAGPTFRPARDLMDVNLTGFWGDQVLGGRALSYASLALYAPDDIAFHSQMFIYLNQRFSWPGITEAEEQYLYTPEVYAQVAGLAWESLRRELERFKGLPPSRQCDFFCAIHQGVRMSNLNVVFQRAFLEARYPFCDYRLVDWVSSMPPEYRLHDRLYLAVINQEIPEVTSVPRASDGFLLVNTRWVRQAHGLWQRVRWRMTGRQERIIHEDPEGWLRRDLRDWAEGLLCDRRTLERGIFNPAFLRSIFERHMSGCEIHTIGKIAPIMTYEMMLRRFYDQDGREKCRYFAANA